MKVQFARPKVSDLTFQVFERSIHPELINTHDRALFLRDDYEADARITDAGHVVSLRINEETITEFAGSRDQLLPTCQRSFRQRVQGSRHRSVRFDCGVRYEVGFQVEQMPADLFLNFHQELLIDSERVEVAFEFPSATRFSPPPLSLLRVDAQPDSLLVHAYHTFPDGCAVVKSQSLFEW